MLDVSSLSAQVEAHRAGRGEHLKLGVIPYVSARLLERLTSMLLEEHAMTVSLVEGATEPLMEALRLEELHAVIGRCSVRPLQADLRQEVLFTQKACLLVHGDCPMRRKRQPRLGDFSGFRWILPPRNSPTWDAILAACDAAGHRPPLSVIETASTKLVHAMVAAHADMLAVLPLDIGADLERLGGVAVLPFPAPFRLPAVGLIAHERHWKLSGVALLRKSLGLVVTAQRD